MGACYEGTACTYLSPGRPHLLLVCLQGGLLLADVLGPVSHVHVGPLLSQLETHLATEINVGRARSLTH